MVTSRGRVTSLSAQTGAENRGHVVGGWNGGCRRRYSGKIGCVSGYRFEPRETAVRQVSRPNTGRVSWLSLPAESERGMWHKAALAAAAECREPPNLTGRSGSLHTGVTRRCGEDSRRSE